MLPLEVGDEVIEVMLIPDKPAKDELVMLVTTAGVKIKQPLDRLMEHFWHEACQVHDCSGRHSKFQWQLMHHDRQTVHGWTEIAVRMLIFS